MQEYEFTLKFGLQETVINPLEHEGPLNSAGCDDALVGMGQQGRLALHFIREATSAHEAIASAIKNVRKAIPDARLIEATPDFVGLTDVADLLGFTRQNMRKIMLGGGTAFPAPVQDGKSAIWHLSQILVWMVETKSYEIDAALLDIAATNMRFNLARETRALDPQAQQELHALLT